MSWTQDSLESVDRIIFKSGLAKIGHFHCAKSDPCFPATQSLDNDVFVFLRCSLWVRQNAGEFRFVESGSILLHRAGSTVARRGANDYGDDTYWFGIRPDLFDATMHRHGLNGNESGTVLIAEPRLQYRLVSLIRAIENDSLAGCVAEEEILALLIEICERTRAQRSDVNNNLCLSTTKRHRRLSDNARAFIDANLCESFRLQSVAAAIGASVSHLCRVFKAQTGLTLQEYQRRHRSARVLERLIDGQGENLAGLAAEFGFSSHSHLCREFRRQLGRAPSTVRFPTADHPRLAGTPPRPVR